MGRIRESIKKYWQNTPERFFEQYNISTLKLVSPVNLFLHARRRKVLSQIGNVSGKKILDVGCGSGVFMIEFIKRGTHVIGIDYSGKMLKEAQTQLNRFKIPKSKYSIKNADATRLPFKNHEFDIVLATGLTDYLTDSQNRLFIKEAERVLRQKGVLVVSFPIKESPFSFLRRGLGLKIRQKLLKLPPIENSFSIKRIRNLLKSVKLKDVERHKIFSTMWIIVARHI